VVQLLRVFGWACVLLGLGAVAVAALKGLGDGLDPKRYWDKNCGAPDTGWTDCADALTRSSFYLEHRFVLWAAVAVFVLGLVALLATSRRRSAINSHSSS
jgi:hypothetical protein